MNGTGVASRNRLLRYLSKVARLLLLLAIYACVTWYGFATTTHLETPYIPTKIAIALIALGITGGIYNILTILAREAKGGIVVLAEFLNNNLLEPQKRRLRDAIRAEVHDEVRAEVRDEVRAETIAEARPRLEKHGINPDVIFPPEEPGESDRA